MRRVARFSSLLPQRLLLSRPTARGFSQPRICELPYFPRLSFYARSGLVQPRGFISSSAPCPRNAVFPPQESEGDSPTGVNWSPQWRQIQGSLDEGLVRVKEVSARAREVDFRKETAACLRAFGFSRSARPLFCVQVNDSVVQTASGSLLLLPSRAAAVGVASEALRVWRRALERDKCAPLYGEGGHWRRRPLTSLIAFAVDSEMEGQQSDVAEAEVSGSGCLEKAGSESRVLTAELLEFLDADGALFLDPPVEECRVAASEVEGRSLRSFFGGGDDMTDHELWSLQRKCLGPIVESFEARRKVTLTRARGISLERQSLPTKRVRSKPVARIPSLLRRKPRSEVQNPDASLLIFFTSGLSRMSFYSQALRLAFNKLSTLQRTALLCAAQQLRSVVVADELLFGTSLLSRNSPLKATDGASETSECTDSSAEEGRRTRTTLGGSHEGPGLEVFRAAVRALDACTVESRVQQRRHGCVEGVHDVERGEALCLLSAAQAAAALSSSLPRASDES